MTEKAIIKDFFILLEVFFFFRHFNPYFKMSYFQVLISFNPITPLLRFDLQKCVCMCVHAQTYRHDSSTYNGKPGKNLGTTLNKLLVIHTIEQHAAI